MGNATIKSLKSVEVGQREKFVHTTGRRAEDVGIRFKKTSKPQSDVRNFTSILLEFEKNKQTN